MPRHERGLRQSRTLSWLVCYLGGSGKAACLVKPRP